MEFMSPKGQLGQLLRKDKIVFAPGAYDALSARIATSCGAEAVYMTGFGVAGSTLGQPDVGLMSATEMAERARALAEASAPVPLIADADNGHGGELNVARMTRHYEQSGVQCIQIEDQASPKRCGHMARKEVIDTNVAVSKIAAAVAARTDPDCLVMARTDARGVLGFDEAMRRGEAFLRAGADLLFIEAPQSESELLKVAAAFGGELLVANMVEDGKTPYLSASELDELGYSLAIYPVSSLLVVSKVLQNTYRDMLLHQKLPAATNRFGFDQYNSMLGLDHLVPDASAGS